MNHCCFTWPRTTVPLPKVGQRNKLACPTSKNGFWSQWRRKIKPKADKMTKMRNMWRLLRCCPGSPAVKEYAHFAPIPHCWCCCYWQQQRLLFLLRTTKPKTLQDATTYWPLTDFVEYHLSCIGSLLFCMILLCVATRQPPQLSGDLHGRAVEPNASASGTSPLGDRIGCWRMCWRRKNGTAASV